MEIEYICRWDSGYSSIVKMRRTFTGMIANHAESDEQAISHFIKCYKTFNNVEFEKLLPIKS